MALKLKAITFALFIASTTVNAITPVCNPSDDRALCSKMTKDAPTWAQAMYNAINYQLVAVKKGQSIVYGVASKLPDDLEPSEKQDIIDTCNNRYTDIIGNLKKALGFIKKDPYYHALQGVIMESFFDGCVEEFQEVSHINPPTDLANYNNEIHRNGDVLLDLAFSRPNAASK